MSGADTLEEAGGAGERPLRIVQVAACPFPSPQGSQVYIGGMARALARRGHDVTIACYAHGQGQAPPGVALRRAPALPGYRNMRAGPDLVKPLLDLGLALRLRGLPADIVHAHNYEAPLAAVLARRLGGAGVPLVYSAHTIMEEELPTYFSRRSGQRLARRVGAALDRRVPALADAAVALDARTAPRLRALGCRRVHTIPPGVDPDDLPPTRPAELPPGPWVVYAGNPDRYQDLDVLVAAMRRLPGAGLLLVSAGSLDAFAGCGLPRLRCVRTSDFAEVRSLLAAATVAALPRAVCSGFPVKLLNYLGMGLPTVAAGDSAAPLPGVTAVPGRDPDALANALASLLSCPERRLREGRAARAHVLARCTWEQRAVELERLYRGLRGPGLAHFAAMRARLTL